MGVRRILTQSSYTYLINLKDFINNIVTFMSSGIKKWNIKDNNLSTNKYLKYFSINP